MSELALRALEVQKKRADEAEEKVKELEQTIESLRKQLRAARKKLNAHSREATRRWRDQQDHVSYPENDRDY
jgi:hypothetical protein